MDKFNLSLDDFSPKPETDDLVWCNNLIEKCPNLKINLFVPAAYCRLNENPHYLSKNMDWVEKVKKLLLQRDNYRINPHGYYHRRTDYRQSLSNNDEFQFLNEDEANYIIDQMEEEFKKVDLPYVKTFRPPGWKISESAARALTNRGYKIAGSNEYYQKLKDKIPKLRWISYNWDMMNYPKGCNIVSGDILATSHTSHWTKNHMNEERFKWLTTGRLDLNVKGLFETRNFDFRFIEDM